MTWRKLAWRALPREVGEIDFGALGDGSVHEFCRLHKRKKTKTVLFVQKEGNTDRSFHDLEGLQKVLHSKFENLKTEVMLPGRLTLEEQIRQYRNAHIVVGVDGSAIISAATQICDGMGLMLVGKGMPVTEVMAHRNLAEGKFSMHMHYLTMLGSRLHVKFLPTMATPTTFWPTTHLDPSLVEEKIGDLLRRVGNPVPPCEERLRFFVDDSDPQAGGWIKATEAGVVTAIAPVSDLAE